MSILLLLPVRNRVPLRDPRLSLLLWVRTFLSLLMTTRLMTLCLSRQLVVPTTWLLDFLGSMTAPPLVPVPFSRSHRNVHGAAGVLNGVLIVVTSLLVPIPVLNVLAVPAMVLLLLKLMVGNAYIGILQVVNLLPRGLIRLLPYLATNMLVIPSFVPLTTAPDVLIAFRIRLGAWPTAYMVRSMMDPRLVVMLVPNVKTDGLPTVDPLALIIIMVLGRVALTVLAQVVMTLVWEFLPLACVCPG